MKSESETAEKLAEELRETLTARERIAVRARSQLATVDQQIAKLQEDRAILQEIVDRAGDPATIREVARAYQPARKTPARRGTDQPPPPADHLDSMGRKYQSPRQDAVLQAAKGGLNARQIAEKLDMALQTVRVHLANLRGQGLLPRPTAPAPVPMAPAAEPPIEDKPEQPSEKPPAPPPDCAPSNLEQLRAEAARQCRANNTPAGPAIFLTSLSGTPKHAHRARLSRMGDGRTEPDDTGHGHQVERFAVQDTDHGHVLSAGATP